MYADGVCLFSEVYSSRNSLLLLLSFAQRKSNGSGWGHANEINNVNIYTPKKITWFVVSKQWEFVNVFSKFLLPIEPFSCLLCKRKRAKKSGKKQMLNKNKNPRTIRYVRLVFFHSKSAFRYTAPCPPWMCLLDRRRRQRRRRITWLQITSVCIRKLQ